MEMALLRRRLSKRHGFRTVQFSYQSVTEDVAENSRRLSNFIAQLRADVVHLVGHSLGGVLAMHTLKRFPTDQVGRVVCLGSPLVDSSAARNLGRWGWGRAILGRTLREAVLEMPLRSSDPVHEVGVIGGTVGLGLGLFFGPLDRPHDGVVTQQETELAGLTAHLMLPVNHIGLMLSRRVAGQVAGFLRHGRFDR
jgi:pimeloyl-ACP methyl ester carboxylesterase